MKISLNIIIKDDSEIKGLQDAVISAIPYVDGVFITSNGKNVKNIRSWCEANKFNYSHLDWSKDFSKQRNFNFSQAKDYDYNFWMDSDDILVGGQYLREVAQMALDSKKDVVFFSYWYGCTFDGEPSPKTVKSIDIEHLRERLIKPGSNNWVGRLHETPVPVKGKEISYTKYPYHPKERPIAILHTKSREDAQETMERNREILELQLEDERKVGKADPRTLLYLMKIYSELDEQPILRTCIEMGEEYINSSGWDEERATCRDVQAICYNKLGEYDKTIDFLHLAIKEYPHQPLHYVRLAMAYFNAGKYRASKHWLDFALALPMDDKTAGIQNIEEMKVLSAQLMLKMSYQVEKNTSKSVQAAELLSKVQPSKENEENLLFLQDLNDLNEAAKNTDLLVKYLESIEQTSAIPKIISLLPAAISTQPFAINHIKRHSPARKWADNEICYFASFGSEHFEKWSPKSLDKGIGGSETAVIELSKYWSKMGYKVTVYGDPRDDRGEHDGVTYLPWYYFNPKDEFNIFIQWRSSSLANHINAKKFLVDLHDMYHPSMFSDDVEAVDAFIVKSEYHKSLRGEIPESKFVVVGNGAA